MDRPMISHWNQAGRYITRRYTRFAVLKKAIDAGYQCLAAAAATSNSVKSHMEMNHDLHFQTTEEAVNEAKV